MRTLLIVSCAALALAACNNKADDAAVNSDMNAMATDNMMMDQNMMVDGNAAAMPGGMDGNMATNSTTENMMAKDMNTNDPDTNLNNGI